MRKMRKDWTQQAHLRTGIENPQGEADGAPARCDRHQAKM